MVLGYQETPAVALVNASSTCKTSLGTFCTCLLMFGSVIRYSWIVMRTVMVTVNNLYCIPTYALWMFLLLPVKFVIPKLYWQVEGRLFHWLLSMVSLWSYSAGYHIVESGDIIDDVVEDETLVLANHQSTSDVPLLMAAFNTRPGLLPNLTWIMDRIFQYTNFGIVSLIHGDFFVASGRDAREQTISDLKNYLQTVYVPRERKWIVLFPEGGFLHKRRAVSHKFAEKNNLPHLQHVTIPRMGAVQAIVDGLGQNEPNRGDEDEFEDSLLSLGKLKYILDITIAYPNGEPLDILAIISNYMKPCRVQLHYRLFPIRKVPVAPAEFQTWLFKLYEEKEKMLGSFYETGKWVPNYDGYKEDTTYGNNKKSTKQESRLIEQDLLHMIITHCFFILSTSFHWVILKRIYTNYLMNLL